MRRAFADTAFWVGLVSKGDNLHSKCVDFARTYDSVLVTSEYVLLEMGDHLRRPAHRPMFKQVLHLLHSDTQLQMVAASTERLSKAIDLFLQRPDKSWSLVHCTSIVIMTEEGIEEVAAGDHHFEPAGFRMIL